MMNKIELIVRIAQQTQTSQEDAKKFLAAFCEVLGDALAAGETVQINGTGSFTVRETPAHKGFNPVTQQPIEVAAKKSPVFKPGKTLKEKVNGTIA